MKPMNPKDRPKVIAMGVISFLMLSFMALKVKSQIADQQPGPVPPPSNPAPAPTPAPVAVAPPAATVAPGVVPGAVSPAGGTPGVPGAKTSAFGTPTQVADDSLGRDPFKHVLMSAAELNNLKNPPPPPLQVVKRGPVLTGRKTFDLPTGGVGPMPPPEPALLLNGVMTDHDRYAMVTCGNRTEMYRIGSRITSFYKLVGVSATGATFAGRHGLFRLQIGDEHKPGDPGLPKTEIKGLNKTTAAAPTPDSGTLPMPVADGPATGRGN